MNSIKSFVVLAFAALAFASCTGSRGMASSETTNSTTETTTANNTNVQQPAPTPNELQSGNIETSISKEQNALTNRVDAVE